MPFLCSFFFDPECSLNLIIKSNRDGFFCNKLCGGNRVNKARGSKQLPVCALTDTQVGVWSVM